MFCCSLRPTYMYHSLSLCSFLPPSLPPSLPPPLPLLPPLFLLPLSAVTLKHLCERDKQRVRQLILELATAGQEKDTAERTLGRERGRFREALIQLNQQMISLERENNHILLMHKYIVGHSSLYLCSCFLNILTTSMSVEQLSG